MGKLADFMAMKRDLAFEFERELRATRNLILGISRVSGSEYTIDFASSEGFIGGSRARAAFAEAFHMAAQDALLKYAQDLAREALNHGIDQDIVSSALSGVSPLAGVAVEKEATAPAPDGNGPVRLAVCA